MVQHKEGHVVVRVQELRWQRGEFFLRKEMRQRGGGRDAILFPLRIVRVYIVFFQFNHVAQQNAVLVMAVWVLVHVALCVCIGLYRGIGFRVL